MLKAANAGDKDALKDYLDLAKRDADPLHLEARKVLPYLNLQNPEIRREVEAALPDLADPGVVRRLAAQGSEKAISALARDYGAPEFMEGFLLQASRNPAFQGEYRDMVAALSKSPGRTLAEVLARQGAFWEKLARLGPLAPSWLSVFDAAPAPVQRQLVRALAASTGPAQAAELLKLADSRPWVKALASSLTEQEVKT